MTSLLEDEDWSAIKRQPPRRIDRVRAARIGLAGALFIIAGGFFAWNAGILANPNQREVISPERAQARERAMEAQEQEQQRLLQERKIIPSDS